MARLGDRPLIKGPVKALSSKTLFEDSGDVAQKRAARERPAPIGGTYSGNRLGVKAKRGKNRPKMKGLARFCRCHGRIPSQRLGGAAGVPQAAGVPLRLPRRSAARRVTLTGKV